MKLPGRPPPKLAQSKDHVRSQLFGTLNDAVVAVPLPVCEKIGPAGTVAGGAVGGAVGVAAGAPVEAVEASSVATSFLSSEPPPAATPMTSSTTITAPAMNHHRV